MVVGWLKSRVEGDGKKVDSSVKGDNGGAVGSTGQRREREEGRGGGRRESDFAEVSRCRSKRRKSAVSFCFSQMIELAPSPSAKGRLER